MANGGITIEGRAIPLVHTVLASVAFIIAFILGISLHYERLVSNQYFDYPHEWFPSVSATIGDYFPERNIFQLVIAILSGPRFILHALAYLSTRSSDSSVPEALLACSFVRTISAGGWMFITSSDDGMIHDACMILYILLTIPYHAGHLLVSPQSKLKIISSAIFWSCSAPMIYFYIQHKVNIVPGAYSYYSIFEWILIFSDIAYDYSWDFSRFSITIADRGEKKIPNSGLYSIDPSISLSPPGLAYTIEKLIANTAETRCFLAECIISAIYWTHLTVLPIYVFYAAVWSMNMSGFETLLFVIAFAPLFLTATIKSYFLSSNLLERVSQFALVAGLIIYSIEKDDEGQTRLIWTAMTVGVGHLGILGGIHRDLNSEQKEGKVASLMIGLLISILLKFANFSLNPWWSIMNEWNGGWNITGIVVGFIAFGNLLLSSSKPVPSSKGSVKKPKHNLMVALAFGTISFLVHLLLTDCSTIIAYTRTGIDSTISTPTSMPHGVLTILFLALGIYLSQTLDRATLLSNSFFSVFVVGLALFLVQKRWIGFGGGLVVTLYISALFETFLETAVENGSLSLALGFFWHCLLILASSFTVAYAFVPGGNLFRERENEILVICAAILYAGIYNLQSSLSTVAGPRLTPRINSRKNHIATLLLLAPIIGLLIAIYRIQTQPIISGGFQDLDSGVFTTAIWTIHFGMDGSARESQRRISSIMNILQADIVGLLETENQRIIGGSREMQFFSQSYPYIDYGNPQDSTWGVLLLSRFPILNSTHHQLPSPDGELAVATFATVLIHNQIVDVLIAHNGQEEDPIDRQLQAQELGRLLSLNYPRPAVFLGYIISKIEPKPAPYRYFIEDGMMLDIDSSDEDRWCEYIFYRGLHRLGYARVTRGDPAVTDTEIQLAKFKVPSLDPETGKPKILISLDSSAEIPTLLETSVRAPASLRPESYAFPKVLYSEGAWGHRYHVLENTDQNRFDSTFGPRYYLEPEEKERLEQEEAIAAVAVPECPIS